MSGELEMERPIAGTSYPLMLGDTLVQEQPGHAYCSLRYDFKPASAATFRPGSLHLLPEHGQAELTLPDAALEDGDMSFIGRYERSRDGLDCVAIFDGTSWRLELLDGLVKGLRTTTRRYVPAATPPLQAGPEEADAALDFDMGDDLDADMAFELEAALQGDVLAGFSPSPEPEGDALTPVSQQPIQETARQHVQETASHPHQLLQESAWQQIADLPPQLQQPFQRASTQLQRSAEALASQPQPQQPVQETAPAHAYTSAAAPAAAVEGDRVAEGIDGDGDRGANADMVQADSPPPRIQPEDEDVPEWERDFYKAPESEDDDDDDDDEHLNHCSDDDSDIGIEHF